MIQVIRAPQQRPSFSSQLGTAVGQGLSSGLQEGLQGWQKKKEQEKLQQALEQVGSLYGEGSGLSQEQRLVESYKLLSQFPEMAKGLGSQLSHLGLHEKKSFHDQIMKQQEQDQINQAIEDAQNIYGNPDLTDDQKLFGVYQTLSKNPTLAKNLLGSIEQRQKNKGEGVAGDLFSKGYNAILEGDTDTLKDVLNNPETPFSVKKDLANFANQSETRKSVKARELRSRQSLVSSSYDKAIASENAKFKDINIGRNEHPAIKKEIKRLEALKQKDLKTLTKNPDTYTKLYLWNNLNDEFLPEEEEEIQDFNSLFENPMEFEEQQEPAEMQEAPQQTSMQKVRFNPQNPEHVARVQEVLALTGGDRDRTNQILLEEFDL